MIKKKFSRIFCVGRNYMNHIKELKNNTPDNPVIFMKPVSSLVFPGEGIQYPLHGNLLHYEAELVIEIGRECKFVKESKAFSVIKGIALGLDLTLRDLQSELKSRGLPWEIAKSFDYSATLGVINEYNENIDLDNLEFSCKVNGELRQLGRTSDMIFGIPQLISYLSSIWVLKEGDLIYTGTPEGVGELKIGDEISVESEITGKTTWTVFK